MIIIGMMIIPIGNDLYQNNFALKQLITGDLLIILSGFLYAVDITLCKYVGDRFDVKKITQITSFICAAVAISLIAVFQIPMYVDLIQLPGIFILSILGTGMSTLFFLIGMKIIGAVRTVLLYSTTSVFGVVFSGLILDEIITVVDVFSLALVLTGIFFLRNRLVEGNESINTDEKSIKSTNISTKNNQYQKMKSYLFEHNGYKETNSVQKKISSSKIGMGYQKEK